MRKGRKVTIKKVKILAKSRKWRVSTLLPVVILFLVFFALSAFFLKRCSTIKQNTVRDDQGVAVCYGKVLHELKVGDFALGSEAGRGGNYFYVKYPKYSKPLEIVLVHPPISSQLIDPTKGREANYPVSVAEKNVKVLGWRIPYNSRGINHVLLRYMDSREIIAQTYIYCSEFSPSHDQVSEGRTDPTECGIIDDCTFKKEFSLTTNIGSFETMLADTEIEKQARQKEREELDQKRKEFLDAQPLIWSNESILYPEFLWKPSYENISNIDTGSLKFDGSSLFIEVSGDVKADFKMLGLKAKAWGFEKKFSAEESIEEGFVPFYTAMPGLNNPVSRDYSKNFYVDTGRGSASVLLRNVGGMSGFFADGVLQKRDEPELLRIVVYGFVWTDPGNTTGRFVVIISDPISREDLFNKIDALF